MQCNSAKFKEKSQKKSAEDYIKRVVYKIGVVATLGRKDLLGPVVSTVHKM